MHDRTGVVEELAVDRPTMILLPHRLADHPRAFRLHRLFQREPLSLRDNVAQSLIRRPVVVHRRSSRCKPALVDSPAVRAERIQVPLIEFQPPARAADKRVAPMLAPAVEPLHRLPVPAGPPCSVIWTYPSFSLHFGRSKPALLFRLMQSISLGSATGLARMSKKPYSLDMFAVKKFWVWLLNVQITSY